MEKRKFYLCDRLRCECCSYPLCQHTSDIKHAEYQNIKRKFEAYVDGSLWETPPLQKNEIALKLANRLGSRQSRDFRARARGNYGNSEK